ncbi:MAG TPA: CcmD family protein [Terriglobia bacterium]|nr:CcmD family protein [Terriglobia bacterium]
MVNRYLVAAYSLVWLIFMVYAWSLSRRQERLKKDLADLEARVREASARSDAPGAAGYKS